MNFIGKGRQVIEMITDPGTFIENKVGNAELSPGPGPGAVVGTAKCGGQVITMIANDAKQQNPRFKVVYSGIIGLEEAYKMAEAVYCTMAADQAEPVAGKRPIVLIVDTPGNAPGKLEEIVGMNKATVAYQLALAEARKQGHPTVALVIGRAISGAFLCHGLHAGKVLCLADKFNIMIHVMPVTSIARIIKMPLAVLQERVKSNPVFASGVTFAYQLGAVDAVLEDSAAMKTQVLAAISSVRSAQLRGEYSSIGPEGRLQAAIERGGRKTAGIVMKKMREEADNILRALEIL